MKYLYKKTKVIFNAHQQQYQVYFKNFLFWHYDSCYKFDTPGIKYPSHYCTQEEAKERAIRRAKSMIETIEVWHS